MLLLFPYCRPRFDGATHDDCDLTMIVLHLDGPAKAACGEACKAKCEVEAKLLGNVRSKARAVAIVIVSMLFDGRDAKIYEQLRDV